MTNDEWINWKQPFDKNITNIDKQEFDHYKNSIATNNGFKLLEIWMEDDIKINLNKVKNFLIENNVI